MEPIPNKSRMPVLFIGHGNPMNAIEQNRWSEALANLGQTLPRPKSILVISAHWFVPGTFATVQERPPTLHDFSGFPGDLNTFEYPAPGDPALARRVVYLCGEQASLTADWGLDHGTWSVLTHLFPNADIPVVQLSVDNMLTPLDLVGLGVSLRPLREEGALIIASGNITHNLRDAFSRMSAWDFTTPDWATLFDNQIADAIKERNRALLCAALSEELGEINHPTPEHYLPLLYAFGASDLEDEVSFPITGFDMGSLSMRSVRWG